MVLFISLYNFSRQFRLKQPLLSSDFVGNHSLLPLVLTGKKSTAENINLMFNYMERKEKKKIAKDH